MFGMVIPVILLINAFLGVKQLSNQINLGENASGLIQQFDIARKSIKNINDYALFSLMYIENVGQKTILSKQLMKIVIIHIGFATMSIGIMLIILGINQGGIDGLSELSVLKFDFKTGSTGVVVFVVGSIMALAGAIYPNKYVTSQIPVYSQLIPNATELEKVKKLHIKSVNAYNLCMKNYPEESKKCFNQMFSEINKEYIK